MKITMRFEKGVDQRNNCVDQTVMVETRTGDKKLSNLFAFRVASVTRTSGLNPPGGLHPCPPVSGDLSIQFDDYIHALRLRSLTTA
jgi:hypothetical protein